jgi:hypothetical protein
MEITEIHRGHLKIAVQERTATLSGEGFLHNARAHNPAHVDYVLYRETLTHWDSPWEKEIVPADVQAAILAFVKADFERRGQVLAIE